MRRLTASWVDTKCKNVATLDLDIKYYPAYWTRNIYSDSDEPCGFSVPEKQTHNIWQMNHKNPLRTDGMRSALILVEVPWHALFFAFLSGSYLFNIYNVLYWIPDAFFPICNFLSNKTAQVLVQAQQNIPSDMLSQAHMPDSGVCANSFNYSCIVQFLRVVGAEQIMEKLKGNVHLGWFSKNFDISKAMKSTFSMISM